jgi:hypothetical protein
LEWRTRRNKNNRRKKMADEDPKQPVPQDTDSTNPFEQEGETPPAEGEQQTEEREWFDEPEDDGGEPEQTAGEEPAPRAAAETPSAPPALPDIPGVESVSDATLAAIAPLNDVNSGFYNSFEFTRQVIALAQQQARAEMQAQQAADQQIDRVFSGRDDVLREYGPAMRSALATVPSDRRHTTEMARAALLSAVHQDARVQGDKAFDKFADLWNSKRRAGAVAPTQHPTQRTPSSSGAPGATVPPAAARKVDKVDKDAEFMMKEFGVSDAIAQQLLDDPNVGRRR